MVSKRFKPRTCKEWIELARCPAPKFLSNQPTHKTPLSTNVGLDRLVEVLKFNIHVFDSQSSMAFTFHRFKIFIDGVIDDNCTKIRQDGAINDEGISLNWRLSMN